MFGYTRFCWTDDVQRVVVGNDLTFSGYTKSNKPFAITVQLRDANRWVNGESIQICFPHLDAEQREILMTGHDNESWERMFGAAE